MISLMFCCEINNRDEEHKYSMQEIIVDVIDGFSNLYVLVVNNLTLNILI